MVVDEPMMRSVELVADLKNIARSHQAAWKLENERVSQHILEKKASSKSLSFVT